MINFKNVLQKSNNKIGAALLHFAMITSSLSAATGATTYYSARRGGYSRRNQNYLAEHGWPGVSVKDLKSLPLPVQAEYSPDDVMLRAGLATKELIIVDRNVKDYHLFSTFAHPGVDVIEIPKDADGLEFLLASLARYQGLSAVHLVSHASAGKLYLGNSRIDGKVVYDHLETFNVINRAIAPGGDLLLYGCGLARGKDGQDFLDIIRGNTHVDVAASDDKTGNGNLGGDWDLEIQRGDINAVPLGDSPALKDFTDVLQVTFSFGSDQIVNTGSFSNAGIDARVKDNSNTHTLVIDGKDDGTYANSAYIYMGGYAGETEVRLYLANNSSFDPASLYLYTSVGRTFTISSDVSGSVNQVLSTNSGATISLTDLAPNTTVITITANGNFSGRIDNLLLTSVGPAITAPSVTTSDAASVTSSAATLGGNVTASGGATVSERGVVYSSTDTDPNIGDMGVIKDTNGTGTGTFSESITGLNASTTYHFKAYAINSQGTAYGTKKTFTTSAPADVTPPAISSITISGSPTATASSVTFVVTFNESANNISTDDFQVTTASGTATGVVNAVSASSGTSVNVTVNSISGAGSIRLDLKSNTNITDATGNGNNTNGYTAAYTSGSVHTVDRVAPTVSGVSSSTANGTYKVGDAIAVTVTFSETVTVTGTPQLQLETGTTDRTINYSSGTGSSTLTFIYTVQSGDVSSDLDYTGTSALSLNGGTITDAAGNNATLTLATAGTAGSLGANKALVIDGVAPTVSGVSSSTSNGTYKVGDVIAVTVAFSETVTVTGTPQLQLETGTTDRTINYSSGTGSSTLTFSYTVQSGDVSSDLDYTGTSALSLNGGTIRDAAGNNAVLTLASPAAAGSLGANKALVIDGVVPTATSVSSTSVNGAYGLGNTIDITVTFSEVVNVTGTPQLQLETGTTDRTINYLSGGGSSTLTFSYTVQSGDVSSDLDYTGTGALSLNGGTITDAAGNAATLTLASPGTAGSLAANKNISVNGVGPTVSSVSSTSANGAYKAGDVIAITVTFSESVTVTGTPQLQLETGSTDQIINYSSGSGTSTLTFDYTVQSGDLSNDLDYLNTSALTLNGGTIRNSLANNASLTLAAPGAAGSLAANKAIVVDGVAPSVSTVSSTTSNGAYKPGDVIAVTIVFGEVVTVTGTPQIQLETGTTDRTVNYAGGTGTTTLTFNYTIQSGDLSTDLDYTNVNALQLNGGTIKDAAGNNAVLTLASPGAAGSLAANKAIVVDGVLPTVSGVSSSTADGLYKSSDVVAVTITFSEVVTVTGTPQLQLETGTTDRTVNYASGSGTATLTFNYTVQSGDATTDLDYTSVNALALNGGTINDAAGNAATLTLPSPGSAGSLGANKAIAVDGIVPVVTSVSSTTPDDVYKPSDVIALTITFSEAVAVTGIPQLQLETGTTDRTINYSSGTGTTTLTFNYTVQSGDATADLDYTSANALTLNGGTIKDEAGNTATLTLAAPGAAGSLSANASIVIDGVGPVVTSVSVPSDDTYIAGETLSFTVQTNEDATVVTTGGVPRIAITIGSTTRFATYQSGSGTSALVFQYTVQSGDLDTDGISVGALSLNGGTIEDALGNGINTTLNSIGSTSAVFVDAVVPGISITSSKTSPTNASTIDLTFTFSEVVTGFIAADVTLSSGTLSGFSTSNNQTFTANVTGMAEGTLTVNIGAGVATDNAGNNNSAASEFSLTYDSTPPTVLISSSKNSPTNASPIDLTIQFNEVMSGFTSSDITMGNGTVGNFATTDNKTFTMNITPSAAGTVTVNVASGVAVDPAGNSNPAATQFSITYDPANPTVSSVTPSDGSIDVTTNGTLQITFNEDVDKGAGNIRILRSSDDGVVQTISVGDASKVSVSGSVVTITPNVFPTNTSLYVNIDNGSFKDKAGNNFAGINNKTTWNFTTVDETQITIDDPSVTEGNSGTVTLLFTVSLSKVPTGNVTVDYATGSGTATAGSDYVATSGTLTFLTGETSKSFPVTVNGDAVLESNETVTITLTNSTGTNVTIADSQGSGTISDDDSAVLSIANVSGAEDGGPITVNVVLNSAVQGGFSVKVKSADGTATVAGNDYTAVLDQTLNFDGTVNESKSFTLSPIADEVVEADEPLTVSMYGISNTSVTSIDITDTGTVIILNDDSAPVITSGQTLTFSHQATTGTVIGTVNATDPDGNTLSGWSIVGGNTGGVFSINASSGQLSVVSNPGFAIGAEFNLSLTVTDGFNTSAAVTVLIRAADLSSPQVVLSGGAAGLTNVSPVTITATFNKEVKNFIASDIQATNATITNLTTQDNRVFTFSASAIADGIVSLSIPENSAQDNAGNGNKPSNTIQYTFDGAAPTPSFSKNVNDVTNLTTATIGIQFSEMVTGLTLDDFQITRGTMISLSGSQTTYTLTVAQLTEGVVQVSLPAGAAKDAAGNNNVAGAVTWTVDLTGVNDYEVNILDKAVNTLNQESISFAISNAEDQATFTYVFTSQSSSEKVEGNGVMTGESTTVTGINLSRFPDGMITLSVTMKDKLGNTGETVQDQVIKETVVDIPEGVSANGDGANDDWIIPGIENYPDNKVIIFNRWGTVVYEVSQYNNNTNVFEGRSNKNLNLGSNLPDGTYYYVIQLNSDQIKKGYLVIKKDK